jgi:DNA-binding LacI/PurR family transcriptional regulator
VGLLLSDTPTYTLTDEIAMAVISGVVDELSPTGLAVTILSAASSGAVVHARDVAMDGVLVYSCDPRAGALDWLKRRKLPMVYVDQAPVPGIPSVNIDDRGGARAVAQHVIDIGHRRVAIVTTGYSGAFGKVDDPIGATSSHTERERMTGWLDALRAARVAPTVIRLPHADPQQTGYDAARTLLDLPHRPSAVLCFSDAIASGVVRAARDAGLRVPADLAVAGFDDNPLSRRTEPALTTVRQDAEAKGRAAAAALTKAIEHARSGTALRARHVMLPTQLVVRESTGAPARP